MTGATITPTGTLASRNLEIASKRACGGDVRGSRTRCNSSTRDVTDTFTAAQENSASSPSKSLSRVTNRFLVMIPTGFRDRNRTCKHRSEEHTSELQSLAYLVCRLLLEK